MTVFSREEVSGYFFSAEDFRELSATVAKIASVHTLASPLSQATIDGITKYALQEISAIILEVAKYSPGGWPTPAATEMVVSKDPDMPDLSTFSSTIKDLTSHWNFNPDHAYVNPRQRVFPQNYRMLQQPNWGPYMRSPLAPHGQGLRPMRPMPPPNMRPHMPHQPPMMSPPMAQINPMSPQNGPLTQYPK